MRLFGCRYTIWISAKRKLGAFIQQLIFNYTKKNSALSYNFVQDETLAQMNRDYLQHDTLTDIITFDLSEKIDDGLG